MSREEIRVDGPGRADLALHRRGEGRRVPLRLRDRRRSTARAGSSEATTWSRRRGRCSRTCAPCSRGRLRLRGRREGDGLPHRHRRPAADQPACGRRSSARHDRPRRSSRCRASPSLARRSRSSASRSSRERRPVQRVHHPCRSRPDGRGPARGTNARGQGSLRHGRSPHDVRLRAVRGARPRAQRDGRPASPRRGRGPRRQDASAGVRLGRARAERVVRHVPQPDASREDDRRVVVRLGRRARGGAVRARARHGHGLLDPAAVRGVRGRRAEVPVGADLDGRRLPARADARHRRADGAERRGRRAHVVGAHRAAASRAGPRRADGGPAPAAAGDR